MEFREYGEGMTMGLRKEETEQKKKKKKWLSMKIKG